MEYRDTLLTIAEIAVALAGFASIVSVVAERADEASRVADAHRLRMMLEVALRNAGFAVLPLPFLDLVPSDPLIWRILSGVYLLAVFVHAGLRMRAQAAAGPRWLAVSILAMLAMTGAVSLANVSGAAGTHAFSLYLASLLLGLGASGLTFLAVAASALRLDRT